MVDIGGNGKESGGILSYSSFRMSLEMDSINLPDPTSLPGQSDLKAPYVFVGDDGFPLGTNLLQPFPRNNNITKDKSIFNYRLSCACRTIDNTFGILAAWFRIFKRPVNATPDHVVSYVKACVILHSFLRVHESPVFCPPGFTDTEDVEGNVLCQWRQQTQDDAGNNNIASTKSNRGSWEAVSVRDTFMKYILKRGEVSWQNYHVQRVLYD
uniref:DDE Tnp4 domain-containing protein n=1 Tax=Amphimedon queenslandica TaxID=400682 RepID=A0A1X7VJQ9_AMPQE